MSHLAGIPDSNIPEFLQAWLQVLLLLEVDDPQELLLLYRQELVLDQDPVPLVVSLPSLLGLLPSIINQARK